MSFMRRIMIFAALTAACAAGALADTPCRRFASMPA